MTPEHLSEIIKRVRAGDIDAFGELVLEYEVAVRTFLAVRLDDPIEAEDLAQEVFLIAFQNIAKFDTSRTMSRWLRGIAANLLRNNLRLRRETTLRSDIELNNLMEQAIAEAETEFTGATLLPALRRCLEALDGRARQLIESRYAHGHDMAEICRQTKLKHSALTMALHRLRERLRDCVTRRMAGAERVVQ
jgi:RNA polymerase sigma-70 factor (ECF subfamily)